ncbi:MAG: FKBP-type peptidyl-prolyl cis-trans isomerase [Myxococcota bacterium]
MPESLVRLTTVLGLTATLLAAACTGEEAAEDAAVTDAAEDHDAVEGPEAPPDVAAAPSDAQKLDNGVQYKILTQGPGKDKPTDYSRVTVKYTVWDREGNVLESNAGMGARARVAGFALRELPVSFLRPLVADLTAGTTARFWIPAEQGYGADSEHNVPLTADIELTNVVNPPPAPEDVGQVPADAMKTASGLAYKVIKDGTGDDTPSKWARVTVAFTGWNADGEVIDSTIGRGRPAMIKITDESSPGWNEAVQLMHRHEKARFWIPESLTGERSKLEPKAKGLLTYEIELMSFDNPVPPPDDVAAPPADAKKTASGLAYKVLKAGSGKSPNEDSIVEVNYTGWTTDGNMFDSTAKRNKPMRFATTQVIPGWTEGLQLMKVGEKTRMWIPSELAYDNQPGKPQGMLVFDVELLSIEDGPAVPADLKEPPADARKSPGGVSVKTLKPGSGAEMPVEDAAVQVNYTGWTASDGRMFDSTVVRGQPAQFKLGGAVPQGLVEGIEMMKKGEKARLWVPEALAQSKRPGGPQGMLVFDLELVDFTNPPPPIEAPADVSAPPADATKTASGLAYKVLQPGKGTEHPGPTSKVTVHYTGWTASDGKMFDSSVQRGEPASFALNGVIKGWTEGLQLMTEGEKARFWIPGDLAYGDRPGRPAGMLVFDVELISIDAGGPPGLPIRPPHAPAGGEQ